MDYMHNLLIIHISHWLWYNLCITKDHLPIKANFHWHFTIHFCILFYLFIVVLINVCSFNNAFVCLQSFYSVLYTKHDQHVFQHVFSSKIGDSIISFILNKFSFRGDKIHNVWRIPDNSTVDKCLLFYHDLFYV